MRFTNIQENRYACVKFIGLLRKLNNNDEIPFSISMHTLLRFLFFLAAMRFISQLQAQNGVVDLTTLANYANLTMPIYITRFNTPGNNAITNAESYSRPRPFSQQTAYSIQHDQL